MKFGYKIVVGVIVIIFLLIGMAVGTGIIKIPVSFFDSMDTFDNKQRIVEKEVYTIYINGSTIYAKSGDNGSIIDRSTNTTRVIQNTINKLTNGGKIVLNGNFIKTTVQPIMISSDIEILINGSIKFVDGIGDGAIIFANDDPIKGNENISIIGGIIDGNKDNQSSGQQIAINFTKVSRSAIDTIIKDFKGINIKETDLGDENKFINRLYPNIQPLEFDSSYIIHNHPNWRMYCDFEDNYWSKIGFDGLVSYSIVNWSGGKSLNLTTGLGTTVQACATYNEFCFDPRKNRFRGMLNCSDPSNLATYRILFFAPDVNNFYKFEFNDVTSIPANTWTEIISNRWLTEGNPDSENITEVWIQFSAKVGENITVFIDHLGILDQIFENGLITFTFDDNQISHYTKAYTLMKKYGYNGVEAYCHSFSGMSEDQMKEMQEAGWDICNHGWEHLVQQMYSEAEIEQDALKMASYLKTNGFNGYRYYIAPGGHLVYEDLMKKYFIFSRRVGGKDTMPSNDCIIGCTSIESTTSLADAMKWVNDTMERGEWLILMSHGLDGDGYEPWTSENFSTLLDYINQRGVPVMTFTDAWKAINEVR